MHQEPGLQGIAPPKAGRRPYYEDLGSACDWLVRCKDCQRLLTEKDIQRLAGCVCGNRKVEEIRTLSVWEWLKIRTGWIDFPHRKAFLAEFARGR